MAIRQIDIPEQSAQWIDMQNPIPQERETIAKKFNLDAYTLSDSFEPSHLPKFEELPEMNFFIVRVRIRSNQRIVNIHQISRKIAFFYNDRFLITIHKGDISFMEEIVEKHINSKRLKTINGIVIKILREVLLSYENSLMKLSEEINEFEADMLLKTISPHSLQHLFYLKNRAHLSRKILVLTDDVLDSLQVVKTERSALRDIRDLHTKLIVLYDQILEEISSLQSIYLSISSQKTNEVMKTLTIFSMFFLPLTFIAGIYGMNFHYMPELQQKWGYPVSLIFMALVALGLYLWFKHKKWM